MCRLLVFKTIMLVSALSLAIYFWCIGKNGASRSSKTDSMGIFKTQKDLSRTHEDITTQQDLLTTQQDSLITQQGPLTTQQDSLTMEHDPVTTQQDPLTTQQGPFTTQKDPHTTQQGPFTTQKDPHTTQQGPFTTQKDPHTAQQRPFTTQKDPHTTQQGPLTTQQGPLTIEHDLVITQQDPLTTQQGPFTTQKDPHTTQQGPFTTQKDPQITQPGPFTTQKDPHTTQQDSFTIEQDPLTTPAMDVPTTQQTLHLPEGSACVTNNVTGTCVKMHVCSVLVVDIMRPHGEKKYPKICSYVGDTPIVCCTSCDYDYKFNNISDAVYAPSGILFQKSGKKFWDKCLEYSQYASYVPRCWEKGGVMKRWDEEHQCHYLQKWQFFAAGGISAARDTYTHMALLGFGLDNVKWLCGGSLISENFILSAGHCTQHPSVGKVTFAALGILKRSDPEELWQRYRIQMAILHPEYRPPSKYHDIALLKTEKPVKFNRAVFPACLMGLLENPEDENEFEEVTAIGWGALGNYQPLADTLQVIQLRNFDASTCKSQYQPHQRYLNEGYNETTQMCYGHHWRSVDTCKGDSGGPLQIESSNLCMFLVIGVTSFGRECGYPGRAGMYTRVQHYVPWIESIVWTEP